MIKNVNPTENNVTVVFENADPETIINYQKAIIELLKYFDFKSFGSIANEPFYNALEILGALMPDYKQIEKAFTDDVNYLPLPENITNEETELIRKLLVSIKHSDNSARTKILGTLLKTN